MRLFHTNVPIHENIRIYNINKSFIQFNTLMKSLPSHESVRMYYMNVAFKSYMESDSYNEYTGNGENINPENALE